MLHIVRNIVDRIRESLASPEDHPLEHPISFLALCLGLCDHTTLVVNGACIGCGSREWTAGKGGYNAKTRTRQ